MRPASLVRSIAILLIWPAAAAHAATLTIVSWNIYSFNDPTGEQYAALVRIVEALNPDILLLQEAQNPAGREAFRAHFASRYPYSFLGAPINDNARNQIVSAYPLLSARQIFTADPNGGTFERPTILADVDVLPLEPGTELRLYAAHLKSGSQPRDNTLRLNQATSDADDLAAFVAANPNARVIYAGDLNCEVGDPPLNKLLEGRTALSRLTLLDPNTGSPETRWESGRTIDHMLYSSALAGLLSGPFVFHSETYPAGSLPPPALAADSETVSDHLTLVVRVEIPEHPPGEDIRLNEIYAQHAGADDREFIELVGPPGASLTGLSVLIIEGDSESSLGAVDRLWKLDGRTIPPNGLFVLGDTAVTRKDFDIGTSDRIENGTETILLVRGVTVAENQDLDADNDGIAEATPGIILDSLALVDGGTNTSDRTYYGAAVVGPAGSAAWAGAARVPDSVGAWVKLSFQLDGSDGVKTPSPGLSNSPGDFDRDGDVDRDDVAIFRERISGPQIPAGDARSDLDDDGDVDQEDFGLLQALFTGHH